PLPAIHLDQGRRPSISENQTVKKLTPRDTRASAAAKPAGGLDHPTQTTGSATLYATSAPLPKGAAARASQAPAKDTGVPRLFSRDPQMNKAATLQPPSPPGTPVASNPGAATGFNGLSHLDQRNAGTGIYANT